MIYFISDTHFYHKNIITYCNRPFKSCDEMNLYMIDKWNSVVNKDDLVIHGGDFALAFSVIQKDLLNLLNGRKILIQGNHDRSIKKMIELGFQRVYKYMSLNTKYGTLLIAHKPDFYLNENNQFRDIFLHGHIHNFYKEPFIEIEGLKVINISVEMLDYTPHTLKQLLEKYE